MLRGRSHMVVLYRSNGTYRNVLALLVTLCKHSWVRMVLFYKRQRPVTLNHLQVDTRHLELSLGLGWSEEDPPPDGTTAQWSTTVVGWGLPDSWCDCHLVEWGPGRRACWWGRCNYADCIIHEILGTLQKGHIGMMMWLIRKCEVWGKRYHCNEKRLMSTFVISSV